METYDGRLFKYVPRAKPYQPPEAFNATVRAAGITFGLANALTLQPFIWGIMDAEYLDPKEYAKLPLPQKMLVSLGAGFQSQLGIRYSNLVL